MRRNDGLTWIAVVGALALLGRQPVVQGQTRIMCVGDSITGGCCNNASYRYPLWFDLKSAGYSVDFVGPYSAYVSCSGAPSPCLYPAYNDPSLFDPNHAAICGASTLAIKNAIQAWVHDYTPNIILIHVGGKDVGGSGAAGVDPADANLRSIIDLIRLEQPNTKILLAQITPLAPYSSYGANGAYVPSLNARIPMIVADKNTPQSPVILVDQYTGFDMPSMMLNDGIHPNTAGEKRMADVWMGALAPLLGAGQTCPPQPAMSSPNTLMALYTFDAGTTEDGTARDVSEPNNRTCVGYGNPEFVGGGYEGWGLALDGLSFLSADVPINPDGHPQLTMGAWVNPCSVASGQYLLSHDNANWDRAITIDSHGGGIGWSAFAGPGLGVGGSGVLGFVPARHSQWQFVAAVYDAPAQLAMLYVDGQVMQTSANPGAGDDSLQIGHTPWGGCITSGYCCSNGLCFFAGVVDNVFVMSEALSVARLDKIEEGGYHEIPTCPVVVKQTQCRTTCAGTNTTFVIDAAGSTLVSPLAYHWRKNGQNLNDGGHVSGALGPTLTLSNVSAAADQGDYDCVVSSTGCPPATSNAATLTVAAGGGGDGNGDGLKNGKDIQGFVNSFLQAGSITAMYCAYDMNGDGVVNQGDVLPFVNALLGA